MVEAEDVVHAFKVMLGREPESQDTINYYRQSPDVATLRRNIAACVEFQQVNGTFWIGQHLNEEHSMVDISASPEQLNTMFERIARDWRKLGDTEPYWSVITDPSFLIKEIENTKDLLYASGVDQIYRIQALLRRNGLDFPKGIALDLGCGVGRLSLALAKHMDEVLGVDISEAHLKHARERQKSAGIDNAQFKAITNPAQIANLPQVDFLLTLIVLQHSPPPVIKTLLGYLLSRLKPGGIAVFQVPVFKVGYSFSAAEYLKAGSNGDMEMHVLPQREVHAVLREHQIEVLEIREDNMAWNANTVSQTFLCRKETSRSWNIAKWAS